MTTELRFTVPAGTSTAAPVLQYRTMQLCQNASGALEPAGWSEWKDVPYAVISRQAHMGAQGGTKP